MVLAMCLYYYDISRNIKTLDDVEREKFDQIIQGMVTSSFRCIAFAHKQVREEENEDGITTPKGKRQLFDTFGVGRP